MPRTFSIFGEYEISRAEQELFLRKLRDDGVAVASFMNPSVGHDVGPWINVSGNSAAHETAIKDIRQGFAKSR